MLAILNGNVIMFLYWIMTYTHNLNNGRNIQGTYALDKQLACETCFYSVYLDKPSDDSQHTPHRLHYTTWKGLNYAHTSIDPVFPSRRGLGKKEVGDVTRNEGRQAEVALRGFLTVLTCSS
jgi:hypothetical protein